MLILLLAFVAASVALSSLHPRILFNDQSLMSMQCPKCQSQEMDDGAVVVKKPLWDWLLFGFGFGNLCFRKDGGKWKPILELGQVRKASRCKECGTFIVDGGERWPAR